MSDLTETKHTKTAEWSFNEAVRLEAEVLRHMCTASYKNKINLYKLLLTSRQTQTVDAMWTKVCGHQFVF